MDRQYRIRLTDSETVYVNEFYQDARGYAKIMCGHNRKGNFVPAKALVGSDAEKFLNGYHLDAQNTMMSMSTFRSKGSATVKNIVNVCCLALDVDFELTDANGELLHPLDAFNRFAADCAEQDCYFPSPAYIEYGRHMRFVYLLDKPVCLDIRNKKRRYRTIRWLMRIEQELCNMINSLNPAYHATPQQLTKFVRVPESINVRFAPNDPGNIAEGFHVASEHIIMVKKLSNGLRYDIHELSDMVLPELPAWYDPDYRPRRKKISLNGASHNGIALMLQKRMDFLEKLQKAGWDTGNRETMCFLFWNFALQKGYDSSEAEDMAIQFNKGFVTPMIERQMLSHSMPRKTYKYTDKAFCGVLGLDMEQAKELGYEGAALSRKEYDREYSRRYRELLQAAKERAGRTKKQLMDKLIEKAGRLREQGKKVADIARSLKISIATAYRYVNAYVPH